MTTDKEKNKKPATKNTAKKSSKPASSVKKSRTAAKKTPVKKAVNKTDKKDKKQKVTEEKVVSPKSLPRLLARLREEISSIMEPALYSSALMTTLFWVVPHTSCSPSMGLCQITPSSLSA